MIQYSNVLFFGNSITRHAPAPELGWHGDWGMAASAEENDYVHVLMRKLREAKPDLSFAARTIADFERKFWEYDLERLADARACPADLTIFRIGENVDAKEADTRGFGRHFLRLMEYIGPNPEAALCVGSFFNHPSANRQMKEAAAEFGCEYLDISHLDADEYKAIGLFEHEGVAAHPCDRGMKAIAEAIWDALKKNRA
ncbi:MAG: SGNH/GDSL hydrolase family protein [Phycisphaerae bacterium]|nr:SGNH/GDSL hydrolase family protein [Phycisphaerae bacterium]